MPKCAGARRDCSMRWRRYDQEDSSMSAALLSAPFAAAAARVRQRLALRGWLRLLARTAAPVCVAGGVMWVGLRLWGVHDRAWWACAFLACWLLGAAAWAWLRRPTPFASLAAWDAAAGE